MKKNRLNHLIFLFLFIQFTPLVFSQTSYGDSLSLKAEASIQSLPFAITINWPSDSDAISFDIFRKLKTSNSWGISIASLTGTANQYVDLAVNSGVLYDYKIKMNTSTALVKYGYLSSGGYVVANSNRGIAIIVVENSFISNSNFQNGINQLITDIELDGWFPKIIYVNKNDSVQAVKSQIVAKYNEAPLQTKLLLLFGNVPIPFSGDLYPDGHIEHKGAWPTDTYYADIDGDWTDELANDTTSINILNHNIPYDGNFDNSYIASPVELQVGRVDLSNLPSSSYSEENLLLNYLSKLHRFKTAEINVQNKALIDDNFPTFSEGFSQSGYNNFAALVGNDSIVLNDYFTQLSYNTSTTGTYLWSYGCGPGGFSSAGGIGSSSNFLSDSLSSVFTMLFGSYFGDWSYSDAFLRAAIAQGNTLTSAWAGRPNWYFQHMAMGENIGYSTKLTQNNTSTYVAGYGGSFVTINLMGEPTLRNNYPKQPLSLQTTNSGLKNYLTWTAPSQTNDGYNIYRRYNDSTQFIKLNSTLITTTNFIDSTFQLSGDTIYYYVKSVKTTTTPSGIYDNESLGIKATQSIMNVGINNQTTTHSFVVYPNPFKESIFIKSNSSIAKIEINNYNGQLLKMIYPSVSTTEVQLNDIPSGIYFVGVRTTEGFVSYQKIVKLK